MPPALSVSVGGVFCSRCGGLSLDQFFGAAIDVGKIKGTCITLHRIEGPQVESQNIRVASQDFGIPECRSGCILTTDPGRPRKENQPSLTRHFLSRLLLVRLLFGTHEEISSIRPNAVTRSLPAVHRATSRRKMER